MNATLRRPFFLRVISALPAFLCAVMTGGFWIGQASAQNRQPIAYIGHGAFFDSIGNEIEMTQAFVERAQTWYQNDMASELDERKRREFSIFESRLFEGMPKRGQARLVLRQRSLEWLFANAPKYKNDDRTQGKLRALASTLTWRLPEQPGQRLAETREKFSLDSAVARKLALAQFKVGGGIQLFSITTQSGQAYIDECIAARVPIPPTIGLLDPTGAAGWKSQGFIPIPNQFIGQGNGPSPAEVRTFKSSSPAGMCYALPRYSDNTRTTVALDGVICASQETSKVCIWDNQMAGATFSFAAGEQIPIGLPNLAIDPLGRYQAGGFELLGGAGGVCTDCHAGENPYITHPKANLGSGVLWESLSVAPQNLPTFTPNRYDPLVPAAWPQNQLSQADPTVPGACGACHFKGSAGRFPHLSNQLNGLSGYCRTILTKAMSLTMPPSLPGSELAAATAFRDAYCNFPPNAAAADAGDPHLTTVNGVRYDFQAAGEFVALKNSDTGFELQTRQSPVQTSFTPMADAYTGLASCVSLNTAVAVRMGKHRVSYQPGVGAVGKSREMQLRIDGELVSLAAEPITLSGGNRVSKAGSGGGLALTIFDGTALTVTPQFWANEGYWYLDINVLRTPAQEGTMGPVLAGDWLPRLPDGTQLGARPASLLERHIVLNQKFADAWRVRSNKSLFDYASGTSSADFTDTNWPPKSGESCKTTLTSRPPLKRMQPELAKRVCRGIKDKTLLTNCEFDVTVMGNGGVAKGYLRADQVKSSQRIVSTPR